MKILFLAHRVPYPPNRGDRIRSYHLLRHLGRRHEVHLACLADEPWTAETETELLKHCSRVHVERQSSVRRTLGAVSAWVHQRSLTETLLRNESLGRTVDAWAKGERYDAAVAYCSGMYSYLESPALRDVPCLVDLVDVDSRKWSAYSAVSPWPMSAVYARESRCVAALERRAGRKAVAVTVVSDAEASDLRELCPNANIAAVPNGVDLDYFAAAEPAAESPTPTALFVGAMDYKPNVDAVVWFGRNVWPRVRDRHSAARFQVVGRRPTAAVRRLASIAGVEIIGDVPDVRPYDAGAHCVVAPLRLGRGVQNKVLEAMSCGRCVIASSAAMQGLRAVDGVHLRRADTVEEWTEAVDRAFQDADARRRLGAAARSFVEANHDWTTCLSPFDDLLDGAMFAGRRHDGSRNHSPAAETLIAS